MVITEQIWREQQFSTERGSYISMISIMKIKLQTKLYHECSQRISIDFARITDGIRSHAPQQRYFKFSCIGALNPRRMSMDIIVY